MLPTHTDKSWDTVETHHMNAKLHKFTRVSFTKRREIENNKGYKPSSHREHVAPSRWGVLFLPFAQGPSPSYGSTPPHKGDPMCITKTPCLQNASSYFRGGKQSWKFKWKTDWNLNVQQVPALYHPNFTSNFNSIFNFSSTQNGTPP